MICSSLKIYSFLGSQYCEIKASKFYSFGSLLPGRIWELTSTDNYRFGFNGKENTNEMYGGGNVVDFEARMYDARLGRWMAVDPFVNKYPSLSPFSYCANNPMVYIDPTGKVLTLAGQIDIAIKDIQTLVEKPEYRDIITISIEVLKDGTKIAHVGFNMECAPNLTQEEINNDPGLRLIQKLVTTTEEHLYEVTEITNVRRPMPMDNEGNTRLVSGQVKTEKSPDNVFSTTPKYYKEDGTAIPGEMPQQNHDPSKGFYDGQVSIHPSMIAQEFNGSTFIDLPRESIVFHALSESYYRTEDLNKNDKNSNVPNTWGMPYAANANTSSGGAHQRSIDDEFGGSGMKKFYKSGAKTIDGWRTNNKKFDSRGQQRSQ